MEEGYSGREVRLEGDQRDRARGAENDVVSSLTAMAGVILAAMEGPAETSLFSPQGFARRAVPTCSSCTDPSTATSTTAMSGSVGHVPRRRRFRPTS
jgi:hypothetical protein